jgi:hypothetical protein
VIPVHRARLAKRQVRLGQPPGRRAQFRAHPERLVELHPEAALAQLDLREHRERQPAHRVPEPEHRELPLEELAAVVVAAAVGFGQMH